MPEAIVMIHGMWGVPGAGKILKIFLRKETFNALHPLFGTTTWIQKTSQIPD